MKRAISLTITLALVLSFFGCASADSKEHPTSTNVNGAAGSPATQSAEARAYLGWLAKDRETKGERVDVVVPSETMCTLPRSVPIRVIPSTHPARAGDRFTHTVEVQPAISGSQSFLVTYSDTSPFSMYKPVITGTHGETMLPLPFEVRKDAVPTVVYFVVRNACGEGQAAGTIFIGVTP